MLSTNTYPHLSAALHQQSKEIRPHYQIVADAKRVWTVCKDHLERRAENRSPTSLLLSAEQDNAILFLCTTLQNLKIKRLRFGSSQSSGVRVTLLSGSAIPRSNFIRWELIVAPRGSRTGDADTNISRVESGPTPYLGWEASLSFLISIRHDETMRLFGATLIGSGDTGDCSTCIYARYVRSASGSLFFHRRLYPAVAL